MSTDNNAESKPYRIPTPLIMKSNSPITITNGKFTIVHSGNIIFHGTYVEFELEESQKTLNEKLVESTAVIKPDQTILQIASPTLPEGYKLFNVTEAKTLAWGKKRSRYETWKRDKDLSYITLIRRNGNIQPLRLGSLLDPESMISKSLKEFSKVQTFLRSELHAENLPMGLGQGQVIKACLDTLEKEGFFEKTQVQVGPKRQIDKYKRTDKKLE